MTDKNYTTMIKNKFPVIVFLFGIIWLALLIISLLLIFSRAENIRLSNTVAILEQNIALLNKDIIKDKASKDEEERLEKKTVDYLQWQFVVREQVNQANSLLKERINKIKDLKKNNDLRGFLYYNLGLGYILAVDFDSAISAFENAIKSNPKDADSYYNLGLLYSTYKRNAKMAIRYYKEYLSILPSGPKAEDIKERITELEKI